jgi:nucleotidyltransferase substrate binding protein (TIGR01987 family)
MGVSVSAPRDVIKKGFEFGYLTDGKTWLEALDSRNQMSHLYDEAISQAVLMAIKTHYYPVVKDLHAFLQSKLDT